MAKRRGNSEGSIYKRKDGRWAATLTLGYEGGKRRRKTFYGRARREVEGKLTGARQAQREGLPVPSDRLTVGKFIEDWLELTVRASRWPSTYDSYRTICRLHILPVLGSVPLSRLTPQHVQSLLNTKAATRLSARTVRYIYTVLRAALGQAVKWGALPRNVATLVDPPRRQAQEVKALTPEQAARFLEEAREHRHEALFVLAVSVGLRRGEVLALRWQDVDLNRRTLTVRHSLQRIEGRLQCVEPKTPQSSRTVPLPARATEALRQHRVRQAEARLAAGPVWEDEGFVFTTAHGTPLDGRNVLRALQGLLRETGLPVVSFHALRHTCASLLLTEGVHPRVVMETLGHSDVRMTLNVYSHVTEPLLRLAADRMDAALGGKGDATVASGGDPGGGTRP